VRIYIALTGAFILNEAALSLAKVTIRRAHRDTVRPERFPHASPGETVEGRGRVEFDAAARNVPLALARLEMLGFRESLAGRVVVRRASFDRVSRSQGSWETRRTTGSCKGSGLGVRASAWDQQSRESRPRMRNGFTEDGYERRAKRRSNSEVTTLSVQD
jgi:hypothetical protein